MASSQTTSNGSSAENDKGVKGSVEGRVYEKLSLLLLAKNGYEHSKDNAKFRDFSIGREIGLGRDIKFDDNVFRYTEDDTTNNFIFVQVKHIQRDHQIDSRDLSVEAARAKRGRGGGKSREFNLQKYFISYLSVREELKSATSEEFRNGKIKYVAIFTNAGLDTEELIRKGFSLEKVPDDIIKLFTLKTQEHKDFYQLSNISKELNEILMKSSDLHRMARELAQYVVWKSHREKNIMKSDTSPMNHYHVPLAREVIQKSVQIENKSTKKQTKNEEYCEAQFRDEFLENDETGSKQELLNAVFQAIRKLDESKKSFSDDQLKNLLKGIKWKIVPNFGETEENEEINLPSEWKTVKEDDIRDFLKCLVLIVNQPRVNELQTHFLSSVQDTVVDRHYNTRLREIIHQLDNTGPELRKLIEQDLGIYETTNFEEKWTSGHKIVEFLDEQKQQISISFFVTAMTLIYESEVMQFGKFNELGKMKRCLDIFFSSSAQILGVNTPQTLLSSIKILQYLNSNIKYLATDGRIFTNSDILKSKENRDSVASAFELERNIFLVIEYRNTVNEQDLEEFYKRLHSVFNGKPNKKIILIIHQDQHNNLLKKIKNDFQNKDNFMLEYDDIDIKYFEPKEDPLKKEVIIFQGQDKRLSLSDIVGIDSWNSYVHSLSQGTNKEGVIDEMTLVKILNNDEIEVGSKPAVTSSLEGAYAQMYEEINVETLASKLMSQEHSNNANDMFIISGITGSSEEDKTDKLIRYLGQDNENEEFKNCLEEFNNHLKTVSDNNLQVFDDQFKDRNFQEICHRYPEKRIFWICLECQKNATKFMLLEIYNPKFYLKRKFKNVIIKKALSRLLIREDFHEIFIFHCNKQELYNFMQLNECDKKKFDDNCKMGKIKLFPQKADAEADFKKISKQNKTVHLLEFEGKKLVWCESRGSLNLMQMYIDREQSEISLVEEDKLVGKVTDRKVVIFADDPGMGKTTTLVKLYETGNESSIIESHWVIGVKLRDHLKALRNIELKEDRIDIFSLIKFLSTIDLKLTNNLSKKLLKNCLDKCTKVSKPLLLTFDGFDEVLDTDDRERILLLLKFLKNQTGAKLWITTRLQHQEILEKELETLVVQFAPMDKKTKETYIKKYLKHPLYLILNEQTFYDLFNSCNKWQQNRSIFKYMEEFLNKMDLTFKGNTSRFIGTPLQLNLMLEGSVNNFKNWIENHDDKIPVFNYVGNDVFEIFENFINRKYSVYFRKGDIHQDVLQRREKKILDQYHKTFAESKIFDYPINSLEEFKDVFLLAGVIKSEGSHLEFIHKTFEEFFVAKLFIDWIEKVPETEKREYFLEMILMQPYYQLVRTFMNLQLKKMTEQARKELDKSLKHYGQTIAKLYNERKRPFIDKIETPLSIAVAEGNKEIVCFLLNSLKGDSGMLKEFLFTPNPYFRNSLQIACSRADVEIVEVLLNAAAGISEDTLQEFLKSQRNPLYVAVINSHGVQILEKLLNSTNNKLDLILKPKSSFNIACFFKKEGIVEFLLQEFKHEEHSLKQLLLYDDDGCGNSLFKASLHHTIVEKLISAAKSIKDKSLTLKNLLLPERGPLSFNKAVLKGKIEVVRKLLHAAKDIDDDYHTLKQLILNNRLGESALHVAAREGHGDIIELLLETAAKLGIEVLEKLVLAVDEEGKNAIHLMVERGHEEIFADSFKILEKSEYQDIWIKVMEIFNSVPLECRLYLIQKKLIAAIEFEDNELVNYILNNAKKYSRVCSNENLRILLLAKDGSGRSTLYVACKYGYLDIIKELLSYAKEINDDNYTLKQLLLNETSGVSTLHIAAEKGHVDVIKLLLETAADLGLDMLEKLINAVDEEGKNAIQLMFEHGHESLFSDSFKILKECKYSTIWQNVREMYENVPLLFIHKRRLIRAIELGDIKEVKDILIKVENSSVSHNESLRIVLLADKNFKENILHIACILGNSEIIKEIISYAKKIDDDNQTLKRLLLSKTSKESALHVAAEQGHVDIIKLVLKTAADLDLDMLEKLFTAVDKEGKNAIQLMVERFQMKETERIIVDFFKMLEEDKYQNIRKKVIEMFDNVPLESRLCCDKKKLIRAIEHDDIKEVKYILSKVKNASVNRNESLRIVLLVLVDKYFIKNILYIACERGSLEIIKEIISYAKKIDDDNQTLKQLLLQNDIYGKSALYAAAEKGHVEITKLLLEKASALGMDTLKLLLLNDRYRKSALYTAVERGHVEITKQLLERASAVGTDILKYLLLKDRLGYSALYTAAERGHVEITKLLLEKASAVGMDTVKHLLLKNYSYGKSSLHAAAERGQVEITKQLLERSSAPGMDALKHLHLKNDKYEKSALHAAAEKGHVEITKLLLERASALGMDTLKHLLLQNDGYGKSALHASAERGHVEITKLLLERASASDMDTLKQLLLNDRSGESALHISVRKYQGDIVKLLLEKTASALGIEMLEKLIFAVNKNNKNAIQVMVENDLEILFADSFIVLEDEYPEIWGKVKNNVPLISRLYLDKVKLIKAIEGDDSEKVKYILNNASVSNSEHLKILLLAKNIHFYYNTLWIACKQGNSEIIKEILSYAMNMDDEGETLKELLTELCDSKTPFQVLEHGYTSEIKQIVENLISEARDNSRVHAVNILEEINKLDGKVKSPSEEENYVQGTLEDSDHLTEDFTSLDSSSYSSSEDSSSDP